MKNCSARPPSLPRIFNHKRYAEAARQDHDERGRKTEKFYRALRTTGPDSEARKALRLIAGFGIIGMAIFLAIIKFAAH